MNKQSDLLKFIELYRSREELWNMNAPIYRRNDLKMKAYADIAAETKISVEDVKKKIKSLRTVYTREKAKIEKSKRSGCDSDSVYLPSIFWYTQMSFVDASLSRRKTLDNSFQENVDSLLEETLDAEASDSSFAASSQSSVTQKRKHTPEPNSKLDNAIDKLLSIGKDVSAFDLFSESVGRQLKDLPEGDAYDAMSEIQMMLTTKKKNSLKNNVGINVCQIVPTRVFAPIANSPRPSTSCSQSSDTQISRTSTPLPKSSTQNDLLFTAMSDAEIVDEDL